MSDRRQTTDTQTNATNEHAQQLANIHLPGLSTRPETQDRGIRRTLPAYEGKSLEISRQRLMTRQAGKRMVRKPQGVEDLRSPIMHSGVPSHMMLQDNKVDASADLASDQDI